MSPDPADSPAPRPPDPREVEMARQTVRLPAVLLILTGVLGAIGATWGLIELPNMPARMDEAMGQIDADPNVPQDRKDSAKRILTFVKQAAENPAASAGYVAGIIASLVVALGGVKLMNLSGRAFPIAGSLLAMIPCTVGCCCLIGLPAGIWSLAVLSRPGVQAVIAARRNAPPPDPDAQYMR